MIRRNFLMSVMGLTPLSLFGCSFSSKKETKPKFNLGDQVKVLSKNNIKGKIIGVVLPQWNDLISDQYKYAVKGLLPNDKSYFILWYPENQLELV